MAGMNTLHSTLKQKGDDFLKRLLDNYVIINEQIGGSFFGVLFDNDNTVRFYKKDAEITLVDRILTKLYEKPILHIESVLAMMPERPMPGTFVGMTYVKTSEEEPRLYVNYLKNEVDNTYVHEKAELCRVADMLSVGRPPILFQGRLSNEQKAAMLDFVYTSNEDLKHKFSTQSFTDHILKVLGVDSRDFQFGIDSLVFRFYESENTKLGASYLAKVIDPTFYELSKDIKPVQEKTNDYVYIVLMDLMNFIESYRMPELKEMVNPTLDYTQNYIKLMNEVFKSFADKYAVKYMDIKFDIPDFLKRKEFDLNSEMIGDEKVCSIINLHENLKEIYKILINFFRKKKKNTMGVFTESTILQFNSLVDKINNVIRGNEVYEGVVPTYMEYSMEINEEFNVMRGSTVKETYEKISKMKYVNIVVDHFQPVTMDHVSAAKVMNKKNGKPCVFVVIYENIKSPKHPLKHDSVKRLALMAKAENPDLIVDVVFTQNANIEGIINALYPKYQPFLWAADSKKVKDYALQFDYAKRKNISYNIRKGFKLIEFPVNSNCQMALDSIRDGNIEVFKKIMPGSTRSQMFSLQKELTQDQNK